MKQTRVVNIKKSSFDIYCGRPKNRSGGGEWGNPYREGKDGTREEVIEKYRIHLIKQIQMGIRTWKQLKGLHGKRLGCFCVPKPCHAQVLKEYVDLAESCSSEGKFLEAVQATVEEAQMGEMMQTRIDVAQEKASAASDVLQEKQFEYREMLENGSSQDDLRDAALDVQAAQEDYDEAQKEYENLAGSMDNPQHAPLTVGKIVDLPDDDDDEDDDEDFIEDDDDPPFDDDDPPFDDDDDDDEDVTPPPAKRATIKPKKEKNMATRKKTETTENSAADLLAQLSQLSPEQIAAVLAGVQNGGNAPAAPAAPAAQEEWIREVRTTQSTGRQYIDCKRLNAARDGYDVVASWPIEEDNDQLFELVVASDPKPRLRVRDNASGVCGQFRIEKDGKFVLTVNSTDVTGLMEYFNGGPTETARQKATKTQERRKQREAKKENGTGTRKRKATASKSSNGSRRNRRTATKTAEESEMEKLIRQFDAEEFEPNEIVNLLAENGMVVTEDAVNEVLAREVS